MEIRDSIFSDPLESWDNPDILVDSAARADLEAKDPALFRILDWPKLREAFLEQNLLATKFKRASKRQGLAASTLAGAGLALLGAEPFVPESNNIFLGVALSLMTIGAIFGILDWLILTARRKWLAHRFWSERLRQFYFQFLLQEYALAGHAIADDQSYRDLIAKREKHFEQFHQNQTDSRVIMDRVAKDNFNELVWVLEDWKKPPASSQDIPGLDHMLKGLRVQRINKQLEFANKNLGDDIYSAPLRHRLLRGMTYGAIILTAVFALLAWASLVSGQPVLRYEMRELLGLVAITSAIGVTSKALNEGLRTHADIGRYENYHHALCRVKDEFIGGSQRKKINALIELERLSYIELRAFLIDHGAAQFVV